ncbi:MAG: hypothetical protein NUV98_04020 [Candidatus Roizmanbacteria bacterium]|nr:hypothetical protein [Candidatus Roizmanbacteria bacterium]
MTIEPFIIVLAALALLLVIGIIASVLGEKSNFSTFNKELANSSIENAQVKSNSIIQSAVKQARALLVNAELSGIKEVVRTRHDTEKLEAAYEEELRELITRSEKHLEHTTSSIEDHYVELFQKAEKQIKLQISDNQQRIINQLDLALAEAHKLLITQTQATHQQIDRQLEEEIRSAKELVDAYKSKRMEAIDRQISELVIETVKRTIDKALTPEEHAHLVIRSLQEAKEDGFFT